MLGVPNAGSEEAKIPVWRWVPKIDGPDQRGFDAAYRWMLMLMRGWMGVGPRTIQTYHTIHTFDPHFGAWACAMGALPLACGAMSHRSA